MQRAITGGEHFASERQDDLRKRYQECVEGYFLSQECAHKNVYVIPTLPSWFTFTIDNLV